MEDKLTIFLKYLSFVDPSVREYIIKRIEEQFNTSGNPYLAVCFECYKTYPCLFIYHNPFFEGDRDIVKGLLVFVDKNKVLDERVEAIFKNALIIRTYGKRTAFYIPFKYTLATMRRICGDKKLGYPSIYPVKIEEAEIFIDEE